MTLGRSSAKFWARDGRRLPRPTASESADRGGAGESEAAGPVTPKIKASLLNVNSHIIVIYVSSAKMQRKKRKSWALGYN